MAIILKPLQSISLSYYLNTHIFLYSNTTNLTF